MRNRYYEANTCYYMTDRKRKRILRKKIKGVCNIIMGVCIFMMIGIVGSVDLGNISLIKFFVYEIIIISVLLTSAMVKVNI